MSNNNVGRNGKHLYTKEEQAFILKKIKYYMNHNCYLDMDRIKKEFNEKFDYVPSTAYIRKIKYQYNLKTTNNLGLKHTKPRKSSYPIGVEIYDKNKDQWFVKVANNKLTIKGGNRANGNYITKEKYIYEKILGIKIPDGYCVIHKDGNKSNFEHDNLEMVSLSTFSKLNYHRLYNKDNITMAVIELWELEKDIKEVVQ